MNIHFSTQQPHSPFLFFSMHQYKTRLWNSGKEWERPGNTYHMSDVMLTRGGHKGGSTQLLVRTW